MADDTERHVAEFAAYIVEHYGAFAIRHAVGLAKEAHRREDYVGEAFWWTVSTRIREQTQVPTAA